MADDKLGVGRPPLTEEEKEIFAFFQKREGKPIAEHKLHMLVSIVSAAEENARYKFEPEYWRDEKGNDATGLGSLPYCKRLHEIVESLIAKRYITRGESDPMMLVEDRQLHLF